jgi:hypothetical protein
MLFEPTKAAMVCLTFRTRGKGPGVRLWLLLGARSRVRESARDRQPSWLAESDGEACVLGPYSSTCHNRAVAKIPHGPGLSVLWKAGSSFSSTVPRRPILLTWLGARLGHIGAKKEGQEWWGGHERDRVPLTHAVSERY